MDFPEDKIKEFQQLYEKHYGKKLSVEEARDAASRLVGLLEIFYEMDVKQRKWDEQLKDHPEGIHLYDGMYTCCICQDHITGDSCWYDKNGVKCTLCHTAVRKKLIPANVCKNKDSWYAVWEFDYYFSIKSATVGKLIRQGKLKPRIVPNEKGYPHYEIFLIKDHKGVLPQKPKSRVVQTEDGYCHVEHDKVILEDLISKKKSSNDSVSSTKKSPSQNTVDK